MSDRWCQWSGTEGVNSQSDSRGYITNTDGMRIAVDEENLNRHGWYRLTITQPTPNGEPFDSATHKKTDAVWGFANDQISLTWDTLALTAEEIQLREDQTAIQGKMSQTGYHILKMLLIPGVIGADGKIDLTKVPQYMKDEYAIRGRLENP